MMVPDWTGDVAKFAAGIFATLAAVWVARINRSTNLAETLRRQEESIRKYLKDELKGLAVETASLRRRISSLERAHSSIRSLVRKALDQLALGQPADEHFAAILRALDEVES